GFTSTVIARASASHQRIQHILDEKDPLDEGTVTKDISGKLDVNNVSLQYGEQHVLKNISLSTQPGSRTAIIGPTAAGKTQLLNVIMGLLKPTSGEILFDGIPNASYRQDDLMKQIGIVFQDSIIFNLSLRENIAFNKKTTDEEMSMAIETAELKDFIDQLPNNLDTIVGERGSSL